MIGQARFKSVCWMLLAVLALASTAVFAQQDNASKSLDEQVQEIKSNVLGIAAELSRLEEKLLYPSGTQVAIFIALAKGEPMRLDAVRLQIDGQLVAHHLYSSKELDALRKGGMQRIYVGNVTTGDHQLDVLVEGKIEGGADFSRTERFTVTKEVKPKLVGLTLAGPGSVNAPIALRPATGSDSKDLYLGEALYHALQGQYFDALQRLDAELALYHGLDEPQLDTLHYHVNHAEFSVGDFELNYRMHHRAGRAIKAVLEGAVDELVRNEAAFRLARIHFQKGQLDDALHALARIVGKVPVEIKDDIEFLRANIFMATGRPSEAVKVLEPLQNQASLGGFVAYNLGIALLQDGRSQEAIEQLDKAGRLAGSDRAGLAMRDKSNLVLGAILFESDKFERAKQSLDRVHLEGPFSNQALLRAGWAEASAQQFERALVPWNMLADREPTDVAVQEAMLAVPNAYANLKLYGRAAITYGRALELFSNQIGRVDASITSIKEGRFLKALIREETRQDKDWVISLRSLPDSPETYYLMELMASHDFHTALQNYLDLEDLRSRLATWKTSLDAFDDIIRLRGENYEPLLPEVDAQFRGLDSRIRLRLEQRKHLARRLQTILTAPRPEFLATSDEGLAGERIAIIEKQLGESDTPESLALRQRAARLRGAITWQQETEYHERLSAAHVHLKELNADVDELTRQYDAFVRTRQAATHSYVGYNAQVAQLRERAGDALQRVDILMARQGVMIETVAINQLQARRERLVAQQTKARFGVADSYDRAAKSGAEKH